MILDLKFMDWGFPWTLSQRTQGVHKIWKDGLTVMDLIFPLDSESGNRGVHKV